MVLGLSPLVEAYLHTNWHVDAFSRLATIEIAENCGGGPASFLGEGSLVPI